MPLGEKLWEEKGKFTGVSIKSVGADGVTIEASFVSEIRGFGRFPSGRNMGTMTLHQGPKTYHGAGQGVATTTEGEAMPWHVYGIGKRVGDRSRGASVIAINTTSEKLAWMNGTLFFAEGDSPADLSEFSLTGYEWK